MRVFDDTIITHIYAKINCDIHQNWLNIHHIPATYRQTEDFHGSKMGGMGRLSAKEMMNPMNIKWKFMHAIRFAACLCLTLALPTSAGAPMGWYCTRRSDHTQPIAPTDIAWVEDYGGVYLDHAHGDGCDEKVAYLTFDAGYENGNVARILDTLRDRDVPGAFFILGNLVERNPDLVRRMVDEGHTVANHTFHHPDMTRCTSREAFAAELTALEEAYQTLIGRPMAKFYRPPEGRFDRQTMEWAQAEGYTTVFWSFAYADWDNNRQPDPAAAKEKIFANLHNGAVILLHPTSATNAAILGDVIDTMRAEGWRFGRLDELVAK